MNILNFRNCAICNHYETGFVLSTDVTKFEIWYSKLQGKIVWPLKLNHATAVFVTE